MYHGTPKHHFAFLPFIALCLMKPLYMYNTFSERLIIEDNEGAFLKKKD